MPGPVYQHLLRARQDGPGFFWLIDPDRVDLDRPDPRWGDAHECGVTAILVGSSQDATSDFPEVLASVRRHTPLPIILFPGSASQVAPHVDAVLFLTLLSGRNAEYLVGEQVRGTPLIRGYRIEPIPTGYILVDTGAPTSVAERSRTQPLPEHDTDAIRDHALCAEYMGQRFVYLEAGSGAPRPVPAGIIGTVKRSLSIPLIVGGGIRTPDACRAVVDAGADFVVVGTALEQDHSLKLLCALVGATRAVATAP